MIMLSFRVGKLTKTETTIQLRRCRALGSRSLCRSCICPVACGGAFFSNGRIDNDGAAANTASDCRPKRCLRFLNPPEPRMMSRVTPRAYLEFFPGWNARLDLFSLTTGSLKALRRRGFGRWRETRFESDQTT